LFLGLILRRLIGFLLTFTFFSASTQVYEPFLVEDPSGNGRFWNFYNARGINQYGKTAEESGVANLYKDFPGVTPNGSTSGWVRNASISPVLPSGGPGSDDGAMASDPKVFYDDKQGVWVMFYFGLGDGTNGHADIMVAFARELEGPWEKDLVPLYKAGGHPMGIDSEHAHKVSVVYDGKGVGYMFYTAVGPKGRGIALLTSEVV
jgi:hypothetical protein